MLMRIEVAFAQWTSKSKLLFLFDNALESTPMPWLSEPRKVEGRSSKLSCEPLAWL
jgi:hypothetical protein